MIKEKFGARYHEMDSSGTLPTHVLLNYFQEAAGTDAYQLGFGWEDFKDDKIAWVITRIQIELTGKPVPKQNLIVETWPSHTEKVVSRRDFLIKNEKDEVIAKGASWWLILNLETRRIARMFPKLIEMNSETPNFTVEEGDFKLPDYEGKEPYFKKEFTVRGEDIDINGHVNNTHYVAWATESVPEDIRKNYFVKKLLITFKTECMEGQKIAANTYYVEGNKYWHILEREDDLKPAAIIYTEWKPR
ncbi:acyl-ACP thioesterase [Elusimicrobium posterum]|uniref:acyl-[acyl-carrier-protein] thioesterase n=1 Tax=Elusimicrobium posterum TaxID=3116653 RepID=UPI003C70BE94